MSNNTTYHACKKVFYIGVLLSLCLLTNQVAAIEYDSPEKDEKLRKQTISHEEMITLTNEFMKQLVQETDDKYKVVHFDTKEALIDSFDHMATREVTTKYIDFYYEELNDGLYIIPTETPPWFIEENAYDMIQSNEDQVEVVQENQTDLYGQYKITYEFTFDHHNGWRITKISYE